jgi:hypothetical protein
MVGKIISGEELVRWLVARFEQPEGFACTTKLARPSTNWLGCWPRSGA